MTRYTRAKGSKSSNEKRPEESTPWIEMKKAILQRYPNSSQKPAQPIHVPETIQKPPPAEWANLDADTVESNFALIRQHHKKDVNGLSCTKEKKKKKLKSGQNQDMLNSPEKGKKESDLKDINKKNSNPENTNTHAQSSDSISTTKQKKKRELNSSQLEEPLKKKHKAKIKDIAIQQTNNLVKKKKKLPENKKITAELPNPNYLTLSQTLQSTEKKIKDFIGAKASLESNTIKAQTMKKKKGKNERKNGRESSQVNLTGRSNLKDQSGRRNEKLHKSYKINEIKDKKKADKKNKFNKSYDNHSAVEEIIVNGEKIKIVKFQGFNVMLDDAERLKKLRGDMLKEGIPRQKLEAALKLERRRAEKALARLKKAVCFHCRGLGHVLSECPTLTESQNTGTGICYKCGSTEHSALACKVFKGSTFQFAECFICKEQGHIAKQCPDNPRGLYPHGGACRECGAVTHLRKDCPEVMAKKEEEILTVGLRSDRNLESFEEEMQPNNAKNKSSSFKKKSLVKF